MVHKDKIETIDSMAQGLVKSPQFGISNYDLPTLDKIPVIRELMSVGKEGLALDIGIGTGFTTYCIFADLPTVAIDLHAPNLYYYKRKLTTLSHTTDPLCVVAPAHALPFKPETFNFILCSEVLEHLDDDDSAISEIARVLKKGGRVVITVPYTGLGVTSFLECCGIKTVHDFPGPEFHVRSGYDEKSLQELLARHGLVLEHRAFYLRFFTKIIVDSVSLAHLLYQRVFHRRRSWTWSEATEAEHSVIFFLYKISFPVFKVLARLDKILVRRRGFGLVASFIKPAS